MERPAVVAVVPVRPGVPAGHLALEREAALADPDSDTVGNGVGGVQLRGNDRHLRVTNLFHAKGGNGVRIVRDIKKRRWWGGPGISICLGETCYSCSHFFLDFIVDATIAYGGPPKGAYNETVRLL